MFGGIKKIHFVGLGGIGISGMAELLHALGYQVSGSDLKSSEITAHLSQLGVRFFEGHHGDNVNSCDMVVYSSAVRPDNPELVSAHNRNIPVIRRAEMLGELLKVADVSVAVAGTHGKTTTSSMIGNMLTTAKLDPTMIIGGIVRSLATNYRRGAGNIIVVEADEFDRSFLSLSPTIAVITNIDLEHLDCYHNLEDLTQAFTQFANAVPFYGRVVACLDSPNVEALLPHLKRPVTTFGTSPQADVQARNAVYTATRTTFEVNATQGPGPVTVELQVPGHHNILNALAAVATGLELEVPLPDLVAGLQEFTGVNRRFELTETIEDVIFVDDYAHHPQEVAAVLDAARQGWDRRLVAVFQPHLYTRTRDFYQDFAQAFQASDILVITDIYAAREDPIDGITGELIASATVEAGHEQVHYIQRLDELAATVAELIRPGDMVMTLGAGDITAYNPKIRDAFRQWALSK